MSVSELKNSIKDYGKDVRLNLSTIFQETNSLGLTTNQIWGTALASAYFTKNGQLVKAILSDTSHHLNTNEIEAAKSAASIMAQNNVYYRTMHLLEDKEVSKLPARLRMNVISAPGIPKVDFEIYCLAVSAISGCGACVNSHAMELKKVGISNEGIQSSIRIASVINSVAQALFIESINLS